jgi:hypothetical protein
MKHTTPTTHSVAAKIKRAAAAERLGLKTKRRDNSGSVTVDIMFGYATRDSELINFTGSLSDWLRKVLTVEELRAVKVNVNVNNSDPMTDYFNSTTERIHGNWEDYLENEKPGLSWAWELLDQEDNGRGRYREGTTRHDTHEVAALAPSEDAARALAIWTVADHECGFKVTWQNSVNPEGVRLITKLGRTGQDLMLSMLDGWELSALELAQAVAALSGVSLDGTPVEDLCSGAPVMETPAPQMPALVVPVVLGEMPQALADYLGRLIHVPKKLYASRVYAALTAGEELPESDAVWADDVLKRVRRYARA